MLLSACTHVSFKQNINETQANHVGLSLVAVSDPQKIL